MKRLLTLIFCICLSNFYAQERTGVYLIAGTNITNLKTNAVEANSGGMGYQAGIGAIMGYSEHLSYQIEMLYTNNPIEIQNVNGNKDIFNFGGYQFNTNVTYNISIPEEDKLYFGPTIGYYFTIGRVSQKTSDYDKTRSYLPSNLSKEDLLTKTNGLVFGLSLGVNATYNKFKARISYNLGLSNHFKDMKQYEIGEYGYVAGSFIDKAKQSNISLCLSYKLGRY